MQLSQDMGHLPIVLIRFNPDKYDDCSSCWGVNSLGICVVKKKKQTDWESRLNHLVDIVRYWSENKSDKMLHVRHLFFDNVYEDVC